MRASPGGLRDPPSGGKLASHSRPGDQRAVKLSPIPSIRLVALVSAGMQKSSHLVLCALLRARFCELLSPKIGNSESVFSCSACCP